MLSPDHDIVIPWDRHFASVEEAMAAFRLKGWQEAPSGAVHCGRYWTLGAALRWIAERSQEAVDRPFVLDDPVHEAVGELHEALEAGEITLSGCLEGELVPRDFPPATWGIHTVALRDDGNCLWPCVVDDGPDYDSIFRVRLRREEVLRRWPPNGPSGSAPVSTAGKERACRAWLMQVMQQSPNAPRPKKTIRTEAQEKFPGLGRNAFDRAWANAIVDSGATAWGKAGRR